MHNVEIDTEFGIVLVPCKLSSIEDLSKEERSFSRKMAPESDDNDWCSLQQPKSDDITQESHKESKFSYTRVFLCSFAELDACKILPKEFDESILRELDLHSSDISQSPQGSGSVSSAGILSQHLVQHPDHGFVRNSTFSTIHRSKSGSFAPVVLGDGLLKRSNQPYRPPHLSKAEYNLGRESNGPHDHGTSSPCEHLGHGRAKEERRGSFEHTAKEQQKTMQEKQHIPPYDHKENLDPDIPTPEGDSRNDSKRLVNRFTEPDEHLASPVSRTDCAGNKFTTLTNAGLQQLTHSNYHKENLDPYISTLQADFRSGTKRFADKCIEPAGCVVPSASSIHSAGLEFTTFSASRHLLTPSSTCRSSEDNLGREFFVNFPVSESFDVEAVHEESPISHSFDVVTEGEKTLSAYVLTTDNEGGSKECTVLDEKVTEQKCTHLTSGNALAQKPIKSTCIPAADEISEQLYGCNRPNLTVQVPDSEEFKRSALLKINEYHSTQHLPIKGLKINDKDDSSIDPDESQWLLSLLRMAGLTDVVSPLKLNKNSADEIQGCGNDFSWLKVSSIGIDKNQTCRSEFVNGFTKRLQSTELSGIQKDGLGNIARNDKLKPYKHSFSSRNINIIPLAVNDSRFPMVNFEGIRSTSCGGKMPITKSEWFQLVSNDQRAEVGPSLLRDSEIKLCHVSGFEDNTNLADEIHLPDEDSLITVEDTIYLQDSIFTATHNSYASQNSRGLDAAYGSLQIQESYQQLHHAQLNLGGPSNFQKFQKSSRIKSVGTGVYLDPFQHLHAAPKRLDDPVNRSWMNHMLTPGDFIPHRLYEISQSAFSHLPMIGMVTYAQDHNQIHNNSSNHNQQFYGSFDLPIPDCYVGGINNKLHSVPSWRWQ